MKFEIPKLKFHVFKVWFDVESGVHVEVKVDVEHYTTKTGEVVSSALKIHCGRTTGGVGYLDINDNRVLRIEGK
jgi:hypothetical protein